MENSILAVHLHRPKTQLTLSLQAKAVNLLKDPAKIHALSKGTKIPKDKGPIYDG